MRHRSAEGPGQDGYFYNHGELAKIGGKMKKTVKSQNTLDQEALDAIDEVFSDTSVSAEQTKIRLEILISEIRWKIDSLGLK
jgi:hypothetical protein